MEGKAEKIFETYKRIHKGDNFEDSEKTKISKEKNQSMKLEKRAERLLSKVTSDIEDDNLMNEFQAISFKSKKFQKNSNTHKSRLKELQKNEDFK